MTTDSVKFLNTKCLLSANITARREIVEADNSFRAAGYDEHLLGQLGRMLGTSIMEHKAEVSTRRDPRTGDYIRRAEVYALSPMDMRKLYDMIRDEIRFDLRVPEDAKSDESGGDEITELKATIDELDVQLKEAKEAAARADKAAETLHADAQEFAERANERLMRNRRLEQQILTQQNKLADATTTIERMNVKIRELTERNDNQRKLIQSLRERSAEALLQRMRDDVEEAKDTHGRTEWTREHLLAAFNTYERKFS